jgi:hypothetical protein
MQQCPDIARITIEKTLAEMKDEGLIESVGSGRSSKLQSLLYESTLLTRFFYSCPV